MFYSYKPSLLLGLLGLVISVHTSTSFLVTVSNMSVCLSCPSGFYVSTAATGSSSAYRVTQLDLPLGRPLINSIRHWQV